MKPTNQDAHIGAPLLGAVIAAVETAIRLEHPADAVLSNFFRAHHSGARDRALIAETVFAVLRRLRSFDALCGRVAGAPARARALALLGITRGVGLSQRRLEDALRRDEGRWLAAALAYGEPGDAPLGERLDIPDWLVDALRAQWPDDELVALMQSLNAVAPLDLRVNVLTHKRDPVLAQLVAEGLPASACPHSPHGIRVRGRPALHQHPLFLEGAVEVQDEGSQLLGFLLAPRRGDMVADFCAGAGGKTLHLGALMRSTGRLYAFDTAAHRLNKLRPRAARAGLSNVQTLAIASENDARVKRLAGKFDRVLVDAPCSGLGTLRRNPDLKWRQSAATVTSLTSQQAAILASAARLVKPGGRLVYATCSVLDAENAAIVDGFLATAPEFARRPAREVLAGQGIVVAGEGDDLRLWPHRHGTDGFYAAVLERRG